MVLNKWLRSIFKHSPRRASRPAGTLYRPHLESLEERCTPTVPTLLNFTAGVPLQNDVVQAKVAGTARPNFVFTEGVSKTVWIGEFNDPNPNPDLGGLVYWEGAGAAPTVLTSNNFVRLNNRGDYKVWGEHTYKEESQNANFTAVTVDIVDSHSPGYWGATDTVWVNNSPLIRYNITYIPSTAVEGGLVMVNVGFRDTDPISVSEDFSGSLIYWGDGTSETGWVQPENTPSGMSYFEFYASHYYNRVGKGQINVFIVDQEPGNPDSATARLHFSQWIHVSDAPLDATPATLATAWVNTPLTPGTVLATFTDENPDAVATDFVVAIRWGDGKAVEVSPSGGPNGVVKNADGSFTVTYFGGTHTYNKTSDSMGYPEGYAVRVWIVDRVGGKTTSVIDWLQVDPMMM